MLFKRFISAFTSAAMAFSMLGILPAAAEENMMGGSTSVTDTAVDVTGTNSFGNMLAEELEAEAAKQEANAGNNIFEVEVSGNTAKVDYQTTVDCSLVVGIYTEDGKDMLATGTAQASTDAELAEVTFDTDTMPQYFYVKAFLVDEVNFRPLSTVYESPMYTQEMQEFLAKTTADFDEDRVLNLDEDDTTNFAVYGEDVVLLDAQEDGLTTDDESGVYTFEDASDRVKNLQEGDVIACGDAEDVVIVSVKGVEVEGDTVKITEDPDAELEDVFEAGVECSSKTMYPDWLSLTGKGYIASMYKQYGKVISPMGCRAFLSPWYERGGMHPADEDDKPIFVGRFNIGAVSLHLPMILAKSRQESKDFYEVLDYYLNLIRQLHIRTYAYLGEMRASTNPLAYCEGGFLGGHLQLHDKIKPILKSATASFGITAFNELQELYNGKSLVEDGAFALEVLEHINKKVQEYKEEDGNLYAIYGTPAENLCGLQVKQFRAKYGIVEGVSDKEYVSNSFHCHVCEDITPIEKQDLEYRFWEMANGGKIQYVKYPIDYNKEAIKTLIRRAMDMGFYEGVNMSLAYCDDCGHQELEMDVCPKCGSRNLTKIDRMNGYLAYSRVHGDTRLSDAKMAEIAERKSM